VGRGPRRDARPLRGAGARGNGGTGEEFKMNEDEGAGRGHAPRPARGPGASEERSERGERAPPGPPVSIDQFRAIELRVGTGRAAELHPKADRLLVLRVDIGGEERQLVAGIRAHYEPAALVGRQVVVVANLEPAMLRGVESQGMVLAASDGDR